MTHSVESKDPFDTAPRYVGKAKQYGPAALTPTVKETRAVGSAEITYAPGVYDPTKGNPIYTQLNEEKAQGVMNRNMPLTNFMPIAEDIHQMARPNTQRRALLVLGDPGLGKTAGVMATARAYGAIEYAQCEPEMRANDLLTEIVFSPESGGRTLEERVDTLLAKINSHASHDDGRPYQISVAGVEALSRLGDAFSHEGDTYAVDWQKLKRKITNPQTGDAEKGKAAGVIGVVQDFLKAQGEPVEAQHVEVKKVDGPILRAVKQNKPIIVLDEFSRLKNYDAPLGVVEVFTGQKDSHTVKDADGNDVVLRKGKVPLLLMTGNEKDAGVTLMQDNPMFSRLKTVRLKMPKEQEARMGVYTEAIEHQLTGTKPTMLQSRMFSRSAAPVADSAEAVAYAQVLEQHVKFGLDEEERKLYPSLKTHMVLNSDRVMQASQQLSNLLINLEEAFNPDSPSYVNAGNDRGDNASRYLRDHPVRVDLRTPQKWIADAITTKASVIGAENGMEDFLFGGASAPASVEQVAVEKRLGTDLVTAILKWRDQDVLARIEDNEVRETIASQINNELEKCGVVFHANDRVRDPKKLLETKLNIDPTRRISMDDTAKQLRNTILTDAGIDPATVNDSYLPLASVANILRELQIQDLGRGNGHKEILSISLDDPAEPLVKGWAARSKSEKAVVGDRMEAESLLKGLTLPGIAKQNFDRLFPRDLSARIQQGETIQDINGNVLTVNSESLKVLENRSETGLAVNVLNVRDKQGNPAEIQVWRNNNSNKTLLVGGAIDSDLKAKLESSGMGITYIELNKNGVPGRVTGDDPKLREALGTIFTDTLKIPGVEPSKTANAAKALALEAATLRRRPYLEPDLKDSERRPATFDEVKIMGTGRFVVSDTGGIDRSRYDRAAPESDPTKGMLREAKWEPVEQAVIVSKSVSL